jgi:mannose-6-phosphate isomerase-like protein (cupin superfamily)
MHGFIQNIKQSTDLNTDFRRVLYTAKYSQLVLMVLKPGEEIGFSTHMQDQFFKLEKGMGHVIMNGVTAAVKSGFGIIVPAGTNHNIINTGKVDLKLYTIYSPPSHLDGTVHHSCSPADAIHRPFDGNTSE